MLILWTGKFHKMGSSENKTEYGVPMLSLLRHLLAMPRAKGDVSNKDGLESPRGWDQTASTVEKSTQKAVLIHPRSILRQMASWVNSSDRSRAGGLYCKTGCLMVVCSVLPVPTSPWPVSPLPRRVLDRNF